MLFTKKLLDKPVMARLIDIINRKTGKTYDYDWRTDYIGRDGSCILMKSYSRIFRYKMNFSPESADVVLRTSQGKIKKNGNILSLKTRESIYYIQLLEET